MRLIEVRDLDGPNLFALDPAIKVEVALDPDETLTPAVQERAERDLGVPVSSDPVDALRAVVVALHDRLGLSVSDVGRREMDTLGHVSVHFPWQWRSSAMRIGEFAVDALVHGIDADWLTRLREDLSRDRQDDDRPLWVRDDQRRMPAVGITGTNGKTTTTRLVSHLIRTSGKHVGWSSSSGVYIDGEQVMEGDYTGPSGARRVMSDPTVDVAVLETARGGILLRGLAYESNDVGVFLNITADHLDMQGVEKIETLAEVKSVVVRVTRPEGLVVLNADDALVLRQREHVRAPVLLFSQDASNPVVAEHVATGGGCLVRDGDMIVYIHGDERHVIANLAEVPMTYGGAARHMVENALAGVSAAIGLRLPFDVIREGLASFRSDVSSNVGRLNVFRVDGRIVVVDYAHNESGLEELVRFTRSLLGGSGRLAVIIGTAGDRQNSVLEGLAGIAARDADLIFIKENPRYLRGRPAGEQTQIIEAAVIQAGAGPHIAGLYGGELDALIAALDAVDEGDAIAIMCVEEQLAVFRELRDRGATEWT